jgi:hypothetical protein
VGYSFLVFGTPVPYLFPIKSVQLAPGVTPVDDRVAMEYADRPVAGNGHRNGLRDARANQIAHAGPSLIVEQLALVFHLRLRF